MNYKIKSIIFITMILLMGGCSLPPPPIKPQYVSLQNDYNQSVSIDINKNTKIFIDNRFDIDRRDKIITLLIQKLVNTEISFIDKPKIANKDGYIRWIVDSIHSGAIIELNTQYDYDWNLLDIFMYKKKFISKDDLKIIDDGIVLNNFSNQASIVSTYIHNFHYLHNVKGLPVKLKLNTDALEKGIAHFTDEYLKKYSLKEPLEKELKNQGYTIVDNIKDADIVIVTENLAYHKIQALVREISYPKTYNLTYEDLFKKIDTQKYYEEPISLLDFGTIAKYCEDVTKYFPKESGNGYSGTSGGAAGVVLNIINLDSYDGPFSTINSLTIYKNKNKIGKLIDLTIVKGFENKIVERYTGLKLKYNEVLSDELIDELNTQAAKQVLEKIQFVEK